MLPYFKLRVLFVLYTFPVMFQEGEKIISDFLSEVKKLPLSSMSEDQALEELNKLKETVKAKNNPYVDDVLARGSWICMEEFEFDGG